MSRHDRSRSLRSLRWLLVPRLTGSHFGCAKDVFVGGIGCVPNQSWDIYIYVYIYIHIHTWFVIVFVGQKCSTLPNVTLMMQSNVCWGFFSIDFSAFLKKLAQFGDTPPFMLFVLLVIDILDCLKKLGSGSYSPISTGNYWGFAIWDYTASTETCGVIRVDGRNIPPATCSPERSPSMDLKFTDVPCTIEAILRKRRFKCGNGMSQPSKLVWWF